MERRYDRIRLQHVELLARAIRPITMRHWTLAAALLAAILAACAFPGEEPDSPADDVQLSVLAASEVPAPSYSLQEEDAPPSDSVSNDGISGEGGSVDEPSPAVSPKSGDDTVEDGTPNQTRDPDVVVTTPTEPRERSGKGDSSVEDGIPNQTRDADVVITAPVG